MYEQYSRFRAKCENLLHTIYTLSRVPNRVIVLKALPPSLYWTRDRAYVVNTKLDVSYAELNL